MSMETFIDDLRNLPVIKDFENGNDKQRVHLNELVSAVKTIKDAADREADADEDDEVEIYIIDGGESVPYMFKARRSGE